MASYYMNPYSIIPQWFTNLGVPLNGGKINTYAAGTTTPQTTYTDATGSTPNSNPIVLTSTGRLNNVQIWQLSGVSLKIVLTDSSNNVIETIDNMTAINDVAFNSTSGNFTATLTGFSSVVNPVVKYVIIGKTCMLTASGLATSNSTSMTMTGIPSIANPVSGAVISPCMIEDNTATTIGYAQVTTANQINFMYGIAGNLTGFTNSGTKGLPVGWCVSYPLV